MVTVTVNGHKHLQKITIDPEVVSKDDVGMLQDLIVAAVNDAHRKVDEAMKQKMGGLLERPQAARDCNLRMSLPASLQELVEQFKKLPGVGAQERAAAGVPRAAHAARRRRAAVPGDPRRQGPRHLLHDLQQHHRHRSVRAVRR